MTKKSKIDHYSDKEALDFHIKGKSGKIEINSSKPLTTKRDLSLAYSPGVAAPVKEIAKNPDLAYNQLIRPWKSRLGLIYIQNRSLFLDVSILLYTIVAIISKRKANEWVALRIKKIGADSEMVNIALRKNELIPAPPPGSDEIVTSR